MDTSTHIDQCDKLDGPWLHAMHTEPYTNMNEYGGYCWRNALGQLHRENDLPAIMFPNGTLIWLKNGRLHRENDKPARIYNNGTCEWRINGQLHRENDLPARIYASGYCEWWVNAVEQAFMPCDRLWSHTDHARWHDHPYTPAVNKYIATFLLAYNRRADDGHWPIHHSVTEDLLAGVTWHDYTRTVRHT